MSTPILDALLRYQAERPTPFHMPGHKLGRGILEDYRTDLFKLDVTEIPGTDNLHYPEGAIKEAQELAAIAFGADRTYFLVNGSTVGIHTMIYTICNPGDSLIVSRDCHKSVINGMLLAGVNPIYVSPDINDEFGIPALISPSAIDDILKVNSTAAGLLITRPNYYGICSDISKIADIVHSHGKILAVDEAHGAHLHFSNHLPIDALTAGADICVQSAHKTLPALTQSAYLHIRGDRIDTGRLEFYLRALQSSSPSYLLLVYLDAAREVMEKRGGEELERLLQDISTLEKMLEFSKNKLLNESTLSGKCDCPGKAAATGRTGLKHIATPCLDRTRIVVYTRAAGFTGYEAERILRKDFGIQVEMADLNNIVCIATISDSTKDIIKLGEALIEMQSIINEECSHNKSGLQKYRLYKPKTWSFTIPAAALSLSEAMMKKGEFISLNRAAGRISRTVITPYPPGIPVVCPGEIITEEMVSCINSVLELGGAVNGVERHMSCPGLEVVAE